MAEKLFSRRDLEELICDVMGITTITPLLGRHINELALQYDMSFKEIARCIVYFDEVSHGTFKVEYGIKTTVTSVREKAAQYFRQLELDRQNQVAEAAKITEYQDNNIIFNIQSLAHKKREPKQLDISEINISEGDSHGRNN